MGFHSFTSRPQGTITSGRRIDRHISKALKTSIYYWPFAIAAWAGFIVSFALPALDQMPGWKAACLQRQFWPQATQGNWLATHYVLLSLANLVMLISPYFIIRGANDALFVKWLRGLSLAATVLVLSFPATLQAIHMARDLRMGYFLWAASFVMLCVAAMLQTIPLRDKV
jgi:hypothetical protein